MSALVKARTLEELIAAGAPKVFTDTSDGWKTIFIDWFENHEDGPKRKLYAAQSEMVLIDLLSYAFSILGQEAQFAVEQRWLAFARKVHLEIMATNNSTYRLLASSAATTIEFALAGALAIDTNIPAGTKISSGDVEFSTDENLTILAGNLTGEIGATALVAGVEGNGFEPGEINSLDDDFDAELTIANTDTSTGVPMKKPTRRYYIVQQMPMTGFPKLARENPTANEPALIHLPLLRLRLRGQSRETSTSIPCLPQAHRTWLS